MKKLVSIILILCMCFSTIASVNAEKLNYGEYKYLEFTPDINIFAQSTFSASFKGTDGFSYLTSGDMSFKIYDTSNTYTAFQLNNKKVNNATVPNKIDINTTASRIDFMLGTWYINYGYHNTSNTHFLPTCAFQVVEVYLADGTVDKKYALLSRHSGGKDILDSMVVYAPKYDSAGKEIVYEGEEVLKTEGKTNPFKQLTASNVTADGISTKKLTVDDLILPDDIIRPETDFNPTISPSANASFANFDAFSLDYESIKNIEKIIFPNNVTCHLNYKGAIKITNPEKNNDYMALIPINIKDANQQYNYYLYLGRIASEGALLAATAVLTNEAKIKTYEEKMVKAVEEGDYSLERITELKKEIIRFCEEIGADYETDFDEQIRNAFEEEIARIDREVKDFDVYADVNGVFLKTKKDISGEKIEIFKGEDLIISSYGTGKATSIDVKLDINTVYKFKVADYTYNFIIKEVLNENFDETLTGASAFYMTDTYNCSTVYDKKFVLYNNTVYVKPEFEVDLLENYTISFDLSGYGNPALSMAFNRTGYEYVQLTSADVVIDEGISPGTFKETTFTTAKGGSYLELSGNPSSVSFSARKIKEKVYVGSGEYTTDGAKGGLVFSAKDCIEIDNILITTSEEYVEKEVRDNAEIKILSSKDGTVLSKFGKEFKANDILANTEERLVGNKEKSGDILFFESLATLKPIGDKVHLENLNKKTYSSDAMNITVKNELDKAEICTVYDDKETIMTFSFDDSVYAAAVYYNQLFNELDLKGTACVQNSYSLLNDNWQGLLDGGRIDMSNHSLNHIQYRNYTDLTLENRAIVEKDINEARMVFKNHFSSQQMVSYVSPFGAVPEIATNIMAGYHWANRAAGGIPTKYSSLNPTEDEWFNLPCGTVTMDKSAETLNGWLDKALKEKKWFILLLHGIAEDDAALPESTSYSIRKGVCREHFTYAASLKDRMWNATLEEGVKYIRERQNATLEVFYKDENTIAISLTDTLPDRYFDFPLTVKVPIPEDWTEIQGENIVSSRVENGFAYVNIVPDTGIAELKQK